MEEPEINKASRKDAAASNTERFIAATYGGLSPQMKVLVALFSAVNSSSASTQEFELPGHLWDIVRLGTGGPLVGESEETNWLKGVCDGILLVIEHM